MMSGFCGRTFSCHSVKQNVGFAHENTGTSYLRPENLCQLYWNPLRLATEDPDTRHYEKTSEKKFIVFTISVSVATRVFQKVKAISIDTVTSVQYLPNVSGDKTSDWQQYYQCRYYYY